MDRVHFVTRNIFILNHNYLSIKRNVGVIDNQQESHLLLLSCCNVDTAACLCVFTR